MPPILKIKGVVADADSFKKSFSRLPENIKIQARANIGELFMVEEIPAKLHFHKLSGHKGIWTMHLTPCSRYKASFEFVDGHVIFRKAGLHDDIDKSP